MIIRLENAKLCYILKVLAVDRRFKKNLHYAIWKLGPSIRDGSDHQYLVNLNPRGSACSIYVWDYKLWVSWFQRRRFLSVSPLMEANDSCGMASLDTSSMDVGMTVFSHYNSMGGVYARDRIQLTQKPHWTFPLHYQ